MKKNYHLLVTSYKLRVTSYKLQVERFKRFTSHLLPLTAYLFCFLPFVSVAQCPDDFTILQPLPSYLTAYTGSTGSATSPFANVGVMSGRHERITTDGLDPRTGNNLHFFPPFPDGGPVIKLGNEQIGCQAEALVYEFTPEIDYPILLLNFAVVFQDPDHPFIHQPRFIVRVTDTDGNLLEDCTEYDVTSTASIPGFQRYGNVNWRDWTKMSVDLSKFVGQPIRVQFINYDCNYCGHYGYCYFTAKCIPNTLYFAIDCEATSFQLQAPEGFNNYLWSNGQTTDTATFTTNDVMDKQITCSVVSDMGCECTLYAYITTDPDVIDSTGNFKDTICEGETYTKHNFNLPPQPPGNHHYQIAILDPTIDICALYISNLELEVIKRYTHFKAERCFEEEFENYDEWNNIPQWPPTPGVYRDTVQTGDMLTPPYCETFKIMELTVSAIPPPAITIQGDVSPCSGELVTYFFLDFETLTSCWWDLPPNAVPKSSIYNNPQITLYFTDGTPGTIIVHAVNGCGPRDFTLPVTPRQSYDIQLNDKICQGLVYSDNDFNLGVQNEVGFSFYSKHLQSVQGCDSSITLTLNVLPMHSVHIEPIDTAICNPNDPVTLLAFIDEDEYSDSNCDNPDPGDYRFVFLYNCGYSYSWSAIPPDISITPGDTIPYITVTPSVTTTYTVTVSSDIGCKATATQIVVVNTGAPVTIDETICFGETYSAYNIYVPNATPDDNDNYSGIIVTDSCTVDIIVNLTVLDEAKLTITDTVCSGERYIDTDNGFDFTLYGEGSYIDTIHFISSTGCDSLVIFNFTINPQKDTIINDNICQFERYNRNGFDTVQNFAGLQTYIKTFETSDGCDSTVILRLNVYPTPVNVVDFGTVLGYAGNITTFTNWSIYYDESIIAGWEWYLDDDPTPFAYTKDASTVIATEGTHYIKLRAKSINGCWAEITKEILVPPCPGPTIIIDETAVTVCGLETVTINGSFTNADGLKIQTLNSNGRKARLTVDNDAGTFTITYHPTIANVGNTIEIKLTGIDSTLSCPDTIFITVKVKPRIRTKGVCAE